VNKPTGIVVKLGITRTAIKAHVSATDQNWKGGVVSMRKESRQVPETVREYLSSLGKKGGAAKTEAKVDAARRNGRLGGRPKKAK
jgi:hypothetical protein